MSPGKTACQIKQLPPYETPERRPARSSADLQRGQAIHQMVIDIRGQALPLAITERTTKVPHESSTQEIRQQQRNSWTRIPKYDHEFNGRLELGAPAGSWYQHSYTHSDGARWTLESRLGHLLRDLEHRAAAAERQQQQEELRMARTAAQLVLGCCAGSGAASRTPLSEGPGRAGGSMASGRRDPRLLPRGPRPSRWRVRFGGGTGVAAMGRGVRGTD